MLPIVVGVVVVAFLATTSVDCRENFNVIAPRVLRPNTNYYAAVSIEGTEGELQEVECRIYGRTKSGRSIEIRESTRVPPDETQLVRLSVGELEDGDYKFEAAGIAPIEFKETVDLDFEVKGYSVFIQTDRAIYRPGNTVQFRAVILSPQLKPSVTGAIDLKMTDGNGNLIREWRRVFTVKGVFAGEVELSDRPVLGNWNISVDVNGQTFTKTFQVAEYKLPKFQVDIDLPKYTTFKDSMTATIRANYALGRPVKGTATVTVYPRFKSGYIQPYFVVPYRQTESISGKLDMEFNLARDLQLKDDFDREIVFEVVVEEERTKRRQNNTNSILMYKHAYKLELVKTGESFKPGMPYTCYLKVSNQDDTPVEDDFNPVYVKSGFGYDTEAYATTEYPIPKDGIIRLAFLAPNNNSPENDVLGIEVKYRDLSRWFSTIHRSSSNSFNFIQSRLATERPRVNSNIKVAISVSEPISLFRYAILGRGNIINAGTIRNPESTSHELVLPTTKEMSPRARLIISYTREDGEIVSDSMDFEVDGVLSNKLTLNLDANRAFPGTTVNIEMKAKPNSFLGLLAIDQSVKALQAGNDIVEKDLIDELRSYDSGRDPLFYPWVETIRNQEGSLYWHTGSSGSQQLYDESGIIILTNGFLTQGRTNRRDIQVKHNGENRPIGRPILPPGASTIRPDEGPGVPYETQTRPPLEGPYAFSRIPRPVDDLPKIFLRNDLPATWLFTNASTNSEGLALLTVPVPEATNTSWVVSGFAINQLDGMGVVADAEVGQLDLFQPFYVLANLPYSVRLGESLAVEMVVFNYLGKEISAEVTLDNPNGIGFDFGSVNPNSIDDNGPPLVEFQRTKRIAVRPNGRTAVSFIITPREVGLLQLKITAESVSGKDILLETLRVEPAGEIVLNNTAMLVDLTNKGEEDFNVTVSIPKHAVNQSEAVYLSAVTDPLGAAVNNIEELFPYPTGCGEQNLIHLLPTVLLLDYYKQIGRKAPAIEADNKGRRLMELAYQNQMDYKHGDGSFSPFGRGDVGGGSVWVTALTAGSLQLAAGYIDIDGSVIERALYWLTDGQSGDGSFPERGTITHRIQQNPVSLSAFVILGFLDNKRNLTGQLRNSLNRGIDFIASQWENLDDPYDLSIVTYTLHKSQHPSKDAAWNKLNSFAKTQNGLKWWERADIPEDWSANPWNTAPNTLNIEATAYSLLCLTERGGITDAVPVANWLFGQQGSSGAFSSTSDTYVALRALTQFSIGLSVQNRNTDMSIQYEFLGSVRRMAVSSRDPTVMQKVRLPALTREVKLRATGSGLALIQVESRHSLDVVGAWPSFVVAPQVSKVSNSHHIQVTVCTHFIEKTNVTGSNMAVIEVYLPSGFTVNQDALPALREYAGVARVDTERKDTKVIIYFNTIVKKEVCPTLEAYRTHRVSNQRPAPVIVYDYYDQSRRARTFYDVVPSTLCDICDEDDCPDDGCARQDGGLFGSYGSNAFREAYYYADGSSASGAADLHHSVRGGNGWDRSVAVLIVTIATTMFVSLRLR